MLEWIATSLSLVGAVFNIKKSKWGFALWLLSAIVWIIWAIFSDPIPVGFILTQVVFFMLNIYGFISWSKSAYPT